MKDVRVELTKCPRCKATCVVGSDEDFQVLCACCGVSFKIGKVEEVSQEEYMRRKKNAKERYFVSSWEAFRP